MTIMGTWKLNSKWDCQQKSKGKDQSLHGKRVDLHSVAAQAGFENKTALRWMATGKLHKQPAMTVHQGWHCTTAKEQSSTRQRRTVQSLNQQIKISLKTVKLKWWLPVGIHRDICSDAEPTERLCWDNKNLISCLKQVNHWNWNLLFILWLRLQQLWHGLSFASSSTQPSASAILLVKWLLPLPLALWHSKSSWLFGQKQERKSLSKRLATIAVSTPG